jgi:copper chaperone CopZ
MANLVKGQLVVRGVSCERCIGTVERALATVGGVERVEVKREEPFEEQCATVTVSYDPESVTMEDLARTIERVGYQPVLS